MLREGVPPMTCGSSARARPDPVCPTPARAASVPREPPRNERREEEGTVMRNSEEMRGRGGEAGRCLVEMTNFESVS